MEGKKQIKISLKTIITITIILIIAIIDGVLLFAKFIVHEEKIEGKNYQVVKIKGETYYNRLNENTWNGEYHTETYYTKEPNEVQKVVSFKEYLKYVETINDNAEEKISNYYTNKDINYIIISFANGHSWCNMELIDCITEENKIIIYGDENVNGVMAEGSGYLIAIPTNMPVGTEIEYRNCYSTYEIDNIKKYGTPDMVMITYKPIIYLYPEKDTNVNVKLVNAKLATCLYPEYNYSNGWKVLAKPNGDLLDLNTQRNLYALYYESQTIYNFTIQKDGFVVEGKKTAKFLEEKLAQIGLNDREAEEFIIYWLPKLEANKYNYIRFATEDEINKNMPLEITPKPDTEIRVLMTYKGLDKIIEVEEQKLTSADRNGFVVVEWGGTEIK